MNGLEAVQAFKAAEKPYNIIILGGYSLFPSQKKKPMHLCISLLRFCLHSANPASRHHDASHGWDGSDTRDQEAGARR